MIRKRYVVLAGILFGLLPAVCAHSVHAQNVQPPVKLYPNVRDYFDSIVADSRAADVEVAACVNRYRYGVDGDTVTLLKVIPALYDYSTTVAISEGPWPGGRICPGTLPSVHTHLIHAVQPNYPSCMDSLTARRRQTPWDIILDVYDSSYEIVYYSVPDSLHIRTDCPKPRSPK